MQLYFQLKSLTKLIVQFTICYFKAKFINKSLKDEFVLKHKNFTTRQIYFLYFFTWSIICSFKLFTIYIFFHHLTFIFLEKLI